MTDKVIVELRNGPQEGRVVAPADRAGWVVVAVMVDPPWAMKGTKMVEVHRSQVRPAKTKKVAVG